MNNPPVVSHRWQEMKRLFEAALLKDEQEWPAFLANRCGDDTELAAEVHRLLIANRDASEFLAAPLRGIHDLLTFVTHKDYLQPHCILCGRFEVLSHLGEGGMGHVYEARDLELHQHIAIKVVRSEIADTPGVLSRFKREVFATRKVNHPNVCRTFDLECHISSPSDLSGTQSKITFLTMELLRGETLAQRLERTGPLPANQVLELALQVANALMAAHNAGIVHCDLKPSNIFLTGSESSFRAVVTDFGIAKVIQPQDETTQSQLTAQVAGSGVIAGTPDYMAPEQFERGQCTPASDIYSYGLVIYEALTGEKLIPLSRSPQELQSKLNHAAVDSKQEGIAWNVVLSKCLQANPNDRLAHVQQVLDLLQGSAAPSFSALLPSNQASQQHQRRTTVHRNASSAATRSIWAGAVLLIMVLSIALIRSYKRAPSNDDPPSIRSVAVLPFTNAGNDPDLNALGDDIAVNLTNDLAQVSGLRVPSQAAIGSLGKHPDLRSLSRQLRVDNVVDGSFVETADALLVQVALVDAHTGVQRWGESYTSSRTDFSTLQEDIFQEIAFRLNLNADATSNQTNRHKHTTVPAAQAAYIKGKDALAENTPASVERAVSNFQQAIDADPQYASAFAQLAQSYLSMANNYNRPEAALDLRTKAESAARRALQLDGTSAEAYTDIAKIQVIRDFDWNAAEKNFNRAVQLDPSYIPAHISYAFFLLTARGRFAEARTQYAYADRVVPKAVGTDVHEALSEYFARQYDDSVQRAEPLMNRHPEIEILVEILSEDYLAMNQPAKAVALLTSSNPKSKDAKISKEVMLGIAFTKLGQRRKALRILSQLEESKKPNFDLNFHLAALSAAVGDKNRAFGYLEKSYSSRQTSILFLGVDALMDSLRSDPRFQKMLVRLNLNNHNERGDN